jgi:hypothetical protein
VFAPVLLTLALAGPGCGGAPEHQLVDQFFRSSRLADTMTLGNIATVSFDPKKDGAVEGFSIVSVTPEQTRELKTVEFAAELTAAQAADGEFSKTMKEYQDANSDAIDRILKAEGQNKPLKGKDAEIQKEWTKWRDETKTYAAKVTEARKALNADRPVVEISTQDQRNPLIVTDYDGDLVSKDITIDAKVKQADGTTVEKQLVVTIQRATLKNVVGKDGKAADFVGRWVITNHKEAGK